MDLILPHLVTPILFTGPLFGMYLGEQLPFQSRFSSQNDVVNKFMSWIGIRNYTMVSPSRILIWCIERSTRILCAQHAMLYWAGSSQAPITEEIVFRSCVIAVYHMSGASANRMIFLGPLSFGLGMPFFSLAGPTYKPWYVLTHLSAHVHHAWDTYNRFGRTASAAKRAITMSRAWTCFLFHASFPLSRGYLDL